jgi:hypothetical protein
MPKQKIADEKLAFEPPEPGYIAEREMFEIPMSDPRLKNPWGLRLYVTELVHQRIGDEAQITSIKVKQPHAMRKTLARIKKQEPQARLYATIKF